MDPDDKCRGWTNQGGGQLFITLEKNNKINAPDSKPLKPPGKK